MPTNLPEPIPLSLAAKSGLAKAKQVLAGAAHAEAGVQVRYLLVTECKIQQRMFILC